jgi:hypothetical protein
VAGAAVVLVSGSSGAGQFEVLGVWNSIAAGRKYSLVDATV